MSDSFPPHLMIAKEQTEKSDLDIKVGACLVVGKSVLKGYNKRKTHPKYANPNIHIRRSLHAELDCILKADMAITNGTMFTYRAVNGMPAMARPCEHCLSFLTKKGISKIVYSISEFPFWKEEHI